MHLSIADLQEIIGGRLRLGAMPPRDGLCAPVGKVVTDSRIVDPGDVFWGIRGAQHDGSQFAEEALLRGAEGLVTSGRWVVPWAGRWTLEVEDSLVALCRLAAWKSAQFKGHVLTIEGNVGQANTAAMISAVLDQRFVGQTIGRRAGATIAKLAADLINGHSHGDYLVAQLRESSIAHAPDCGRLDRPDLAVFVHAGTNNGQSAVTIEPMPIMQRLQSLLSAGVPAVVNGDDAHLRRAVGDATSAIIVGQDMPAQVVATCVECSSGQLRFLVGAQRFSVAAYSRRQLASALAAIAVGRVFGMNDADIAEGLAAYRPEQRFFSAVESESSSSAQPTETFSQKSGGSRAWPNASFEHEVIHPPAAWPHWQ
jgi:UDP-N-acetylmuramyl pentapeptide synthase